ncbi:MAG TPA: YggS family pyridoxal phosphate-dependent enzyme [Clostridia bacterium]|nr:YggS family pyridoxal phosphate-dependent enzyme [Clostridia bacterium]
MTDIKAKLKIINEKISEAAEKSGRKREDITLIAVTKSKPPEMINEAIKCGADIIGENKVQELMAKIDYITGYSQIHFIGQLQTNKVKYIIDKVDLIQSVDRLQLATEIDKRAAALAKKIPVLVEVNTAGEETKAGIAPGEVRAFIERIAQLPNITVRGLMTVAPYSSNPDNVRPYFNKMRELFESLKGVGREDFTMQYLSMGMSNDYEAAIAEGSNMVRIGTAIFGIR